MIVAQPPHTGVCRGCAERSIHLVAVECQYGWDAIYHPETQRVPDVGARNGPRQTQPECAHPPAKYQEIDGADDERILWSGLVADTPRAIALGDSLCSAQRADKRQLVEHDEPDGQADDGNTQHPGNGRPHTAEPEPDEHEPDDAHDDVW